MKMGTLWLCMVGGWGREGVILRWRTLESSGSEQVGELVGEWMSGWVGE